MQFALTGCSISLGAVPFQTRTLDIPWRRYNSTKLIIRITTLSKQALLEIIQDMEVLVSRPLPLLQNSNPRASIVHRGCKAIMKCPQTLSEEEVYQVSFANEQIAQAAINAIRPYFNIAATVPANNAGVKRARPQIQSQSQVRRAPPLPQYPGPQMYDFAGSDNHPYHPSQAPLHHTHSTHPPTQEYPGLPTPLPSTGGVIIPPTMPIPRTSPSIPTVSPTLPIPSTPAEPVRESSPPPLEESQSAETQFLETQYSAPKGSSSSSCDKPSNAQIQKSSPNLESDETLEDPPKRDTSTAVEGDLLSMDDDEIKYSPGLAAHPALDPYEGMPWSSSMAQNGQGRDPARPNRYIDAGVYSMTDDQLYDIIGEIVIETGFQGMCERVWRVLDARFNGANRDEMYDEDAF